MSEVWPVMESFQKRERRVSKELDRAEIVDSFSAEDRKKKQKGIKEKGNEGEWKRPVTNQPGESENKYNRITVQSRAQQKALQ